MLPGSTFEMTPKGSMTSEKFVLWLEHFSNFKPEGKCLLVLDGAKCHMSLVIANKAEELDVILFFFCRQIQLMSFNRLTSLSTSLLKYTGMKKCCASGKENKIQS